VNGIKKLSELEEDQLDQAISVFVEGFHLLLSGITKDKVKLHKLFKASLDYNMTYAYMLDGKAIGFMGLADDKKRPTKFDKEIYQQTVGGLSGKMSFKSVSATFEGLKELDQQEIFIDFIVTSQEHRGKGVGTQLIAFVRDTLGYKKIRLETYSKNTQAISFYEGLGFKIIKVKKSIMMKLAGYGSLLTLKFEAGQT
jgi:ribosomal protein S18 acetylase RimI-like enzyme